MFKAMFKEIFLEHVLELFPQEKRSKLRLLEMGAGTSDAIVPTLKKYPGISYTAVEPSPTHEKAKQTLKEFKNVTLIQSPAYELPFEEGSFDLVFSLSVLEHVKQLERFLAESVRVTKGGGYVIHRYDLGHALTPSNTKERFQVFLGNNTPQVLPEHKFVCYVDPDDVAKSMEAKGVEIINTTYHQMPEHKDVTRYIQPTTKEKEKLLRDMIEWEFELSEHAEDIPKDKREKLFPAIALWGKKA